MEKRSIYADVTSSESASKSARIVIAGESKIVYSGWRRNDNLTKYHCYPCSLNLGKCLQCRNDLRRYFNQIPISKDGYIKVEGLLCRRCGAFYTYHKQLLCDAIALSPEKSLFNVDYRYDVLLITIAGVKKVAYLMHPLYSREIIHNCFIGFFPLGTCPICGSILKSYTNPIPILRDRYINIEGKFCRNCKAFFTPHKKLLHGAMSLCPNPDAFKIDDCYDDSLKYGNHFSYLQELSSALMQITVYRKDDLRIYTIVDLRKQANPKENVLHIANDTARILLTAAILHDTNVEIDGEIFAIKQVRYKDNSRNILHILKPSVSVEIKRNGGYYAPGFEVFDGLVFCEKNRSLEILRVSYDKENDVYFVDGEKYEEFRRKFGYPIVHYVSENSENGFAELQEESLLHQLGYTVNAKDDLSDKNRQKILGDCIDFGLLDVRAIVNLLKSLIKRNGAWNPQCIPKWEMDLEYIRNYRVNPERSVFIQKIRRL